MKLTKRGGRWLVEWIDETGRRRRVSTGEEDRGKAAKAAPAIMQGESPRKATLSTDGNTLKAWLSKTYEAHWKHKKAAYTFWCNIHVVEGDAISALPVAAVDYTALSDFAQRMRQAGRQPGTVNRLLALITRALSEAVKSKVIGVVPPVPGMVVYIGDEYLPRLIDQGAVGDMCGIYYDRNGRLIKSGIEDRMIAASIDQLRAAGSLVAVACGEDKAVAALGALRAGLVSTLFVDQAMAERILDEIKAENRRPN